MMNNKKRETKNRIVTRVVVTKEINLSWSLINLATHTMIIMTMMTIMSHNLHWMHVLFFTRFSHTLSQFDYSQLASTNNNNSYNKNVTIFSLSYIASRFLINTTTILLYRCFLLHLFKHICCRFTYDYYIFFV